MTARLWSVDHHQPLRIFAGHYCDVVALIFIGIQTTSQPDLMALWDVTSGSCVRTMTGHKGSVHTLAFSPNGKYLVSAGVDTSIVLWDHSSGDVVCKLSGHTDLIFHLHLVKKDRFSPPEAETIA